MAIPRVERTLSKILLNATGLIRTRVISKSTLVSALIPAFLVATINDSHAAEDTIRGTTASTMPHPELSPFGLHKDSFIFLPSVTYSLSYDDNVFGTKTDTESSYVSDITPSITASSNWNNHALSFSAVSSLGKNHSFSSEDYLDWDIGTDGSLDLRHDIKLSAGASIGHDHIERTAPDDVRGVEPTEFDKRRIYLRYSQKFGRMVGSANLNIIDKAFEDVDAISLGVPFEIDNSIRDRTEYTLRLRGAFQYVGDEQVFISIKGFERDYDKLAPFNDRDKSSTGLETSVGASFDYHGTLLGEISLGYRAQDYNDPLPDIEAPVAAASIQWNITDLTTMSAGLDYSIQESISQFFSGYISRSTVVSLDHELTRSLVLNLSLQYVEDNYEGIDPADRNDETYFFTAGATYKMNRNLYYAAQYTYLERESKLNTTTIDSSQFDFRKNLISFQLIAQF